jgi:uncharacterized protein (TIGR02271 family)
MLSDQQGLTNDQQKGEVKVELHKEELQLVKKWIETADVKIYKNIYTEEKKIAVPVKREELIIEKRDLKGVGDSHNETIRIPLSEERIEVIVHPIELENVEIYKKQFEELMQVNETLKKEIGHIDITGDLKITEIDQFSPQ